MGRNELVEPSRPFDVRDANPEMVDPAVLAQATVMNRLGAVPVGIEEERAVVVLPILRARARRARIALVGLDSGAPELVDVRARRGSKADVEPAGSLASPTWPARWRSRPTRRRVSARFRVCSGPGRRTAPMPGGPRRGASVIEHALDYVKPGDRSGPYNRSDVPASLGPHAPSGQPRGRACADGNGLLQRVPDVCLD
jgi:hypothetical protein